MQFVDTHCHLYMMNADGKLEFFIEKAVENGIKRILVPAIDYETSLDAINIAEKFEIVYAAIGIHPNDAGKWNNDSFPNLLELTKHPKVKAIGEIGLDYYRDYVPRDEQIFVFNEQLRLSEISGLPIIVHSRDSISEIITLLIEWKNGIMQLSHDKILGVIHSFEGNLEQANQIAANNFFIGIGGPITYKNATEKHEIGRHFSIKSIVLETDSPFLSPHPYRGKPNEPANIKFIAEKIANLSEKPLKWIAQETNKNANKLFAWEQ